MNGASKEAHSQSRSSGERGGAGGGRKRKYSSRMRQLAPHVTRLASTYQFAGDSPPMESARERNNVASQSSRGRRKMYMQLLEEQITEIELELESASHSIEVLRT
jgi:hypothetical protein